MNCLRNSVRGYTEAIPERFVIVTQHEKAYVVRKSGTEMLVHVAIYSVHNHLVPYRCVLCEFPQKAGQVVKQRILAYVALYAFAARDCDQHVEHGPEEQHEGRYLVRPPDGLLGELLVPDRTR